MNGFRFTKLFCELNEPDQTELTDGFTQTHIYPKIVGNNLRPIIVNQSQSFVYHHQLSLCRPLPPIKSLNIELPKLVGEVRSNLNTP